MTQDELRARWGPDPVAFALEVLGVDPGQFESWQREALAALAETPDARVVVVGGRGAGKSHLGALFCLWLVGTRRDSQWVSLTPVWSQNKNAVWRKVRKLWRRSKYPLGGQMLTTSWEVSEDHVAYAVNPPSVDELEGPHGETATGVYVDEAKGVAASMIDGLEGCLSASPENKFLVTSSGCLADGRPLHAMMTTLEGWVRFRVPAVPIPGCRSHTLRPKRSWVADRAAEWGEDSAVYIAQILAGFFLHDETLLLPLDWVERARSYNGEALDGPGRVGVDVARFGEDCSVAIAAHGGRVDDARRVHGFDGMEVAGMAAALAREQDAEEIEIDAIGIGGPVGDRLRELGCNVADFKASETAHDEDRFLKRRSEKLWALREAFKENRVDLREMPRSIYERLLGEASVLGFSYSSDGHIEVDSKKTYERKSRGMRGKLRGHGSPDVIEALAFAIAEPDDVGNEGFTEEDYEAFEMIPRDDPY